MLVEAGIDVERCKNWSENTRGEVVERVSNKMLEGEDLRVIQNPNGLEVWLKMSSLDEDGVEVLGGRGKTCSGIWNWVREVS